MRFPAKITECTVTLLPNFLKWVDLLSYGALRARAWSSAKTYTELGKSALHRPIANMATISPKRGFSVATVAKGWSLVYMLMRVRYLVVFFTLETIKKLSEEVSVGSVC